MDHILAAQSNAETKPDKQFRMRRATRNFPGLLFVQALGQLHPLFGIDASRMQRAQRTRKFTHLQKELCRKVAQSSLRHLPLRDSMPNRMTSERAPLFHHRENFAYEAVIRSHG